MSNADDGDHEHESLSYYITSPCHAIFDADQCNTHRSGYVARRLSGGPHSVGGWSMMGSMTYIEVGDLHVACCIFSLLSLRLILSDDIGEDGAGKIRVIIELEWS